jgi:hypothetical protein
MSAKTTCRFGAAGRRLFDEVSGAFQLDAHELVLLTQAAHTADAMDGLQRQVDKDGLLIRKDFEGPLRAHPALVELRNQRLVYARLIGALRVVGDIERPSGKGRTTNFEGERRPLRGVSGGGA